MSDFKNIGGIRQEYFITTGKAAFITVNGLSVPTAGYSRYLEELVVALANGVENPTDPALNLHGVNDLLVDFQHYLVLDGALDIDEDEIKRNAEVYSTNRR